MKERIVAICNNPRVLFIMLLKKFSFLLSDILYIRLLFRVGCGYWPNLVKPRTFNEKLAWLKINHHNPRLTLMADKYEVKKIVAEIVGSEYVVENYGVWDRYEDIPFGALPDQFVLKATHDSGGAFICNDKATFDYEKVENVLKRNLKRNFYFAGREWPYKNIRPRIIADKYLDDHTGSELRDYKFWCFNGEPKYMYITIKGENVYENFYDMNYNVANINHGFPRHIPEFDKPAGFEKMIELATKLSKDLPFVRVDFFQVDGKIYFGEYTFFDWGGDKSFCSYEMDLTLGGMIDLSTVRN